MNPLDMTIIIILCFCLIRGFFRGLVKELSSIIGVLGGFYAAYTYYNPLTLYVLKWVSCFEHINIICFLIIFFTVFITISMLGVLIKYIMNIAFLTWFDRLCGTFFGLVKGLLLTSILLMILVTFLNIEKSFVAKSIIAPHIMIISKTMTKLISPGIKKQINDKIKELKKLGTSING